MSNNNLCRAKCAKNNEFYTRLEDIEAELQYYSQWFSGKVVYCNCDDYTKSNFFKYFCDNFQRLGLKKLIATNYGQKPKCAVLDANGLTVSNLSSGDFRDPECVELLKTADIVVTNPPFSLFREYVAQLTEHDKQFLVIGNINAVTYKNIFPLIQHDKMWLGVTYPKKFTDPTGATRNFCNVCWFTNLSVKQPKLSLSKKYNPAAYPKYSNYDAIEVSRVADIPTDYTGVMGVPITFLRYYHPSRFVLVAHKEPMLDLCHCRRSYKSRQVKYKGIVRQKTYHRLFIRWRLIDINPHFFAQPRKTIKQLKIAGKKDPYARILIRRA